MNISLITRVPNIISCAMVKYRIYDILLHTVLITYSLIATACSIDSVSNVVTGTSKQILHIGNGDEPQDLDPHIVTGVPEHHIITALLEGLVGKDPVDLTPVPAVAKTWEISDNGKTYLFNLRENARWSNNDRLTAHDFVYAWKRALMPNLGNQYAYMLYPIANAEEFNKGKIQDFSEVGVRARDIHTLEVRLEYSTPYFLSLLDHYSTFPIHQLTVEAFGKIDTRGSEWTRAGNFVGNGAFSLKTWEQNRIIVVKKNLHYWDAASVRLNEIHFYPVAQTTTEERMFRTGQLHITSSIPTEKIVTYQSESPHLIRIQPYLGTYFYRFNTTKPPLNDVRVRRALAMTIDRQTITDKVTKGGQFPAYALTPPDTLGYTAQSRIPYDAEKARQLLAEAGYPDGTGFPTIQLLFNTAEGHQQIAVAIQQMWKRTLNIDLTLQNVDWKVFLETERTMNFQITRASWIGDYVDPNTFLDMFITESGNNRTGWSNDEYDDLITLASQTSDQVQRYAYFQRAEEILMDEAPIVPIYTYTRNFLISPDVQGWNRNILDHQSYKHVYLEAPSPT